MKTNQPSSIVQLKSGKEVGLNMTVENFAEYVRLNKSHVFMHVRGFEQVLKEGHWVYVETPVVIAIDSIEKVIAFGL